MRLGASGAFTHLGRLRATEKQVVTRASDKAPGLFWGLERSTHYILISESGLYKLFMRSNTPLAQEMQHWIAAEVLPAIRKDV